MSLAHDAPAEVDWKAETSQIVSALRERFGSEFPRLASADLDELAANYSTELPEVSLYAIGQELEHLGMALHEIPSGSDSYILVVTDVGAEPMMSGSRLRVLRQPRRRAGAAAKRLKLAATIPHRRAPGYIGSGEIIVGGRLLMLPHYQHEDRWVDLSGSWPPAVTVAEHNLMSVAVNHDSSVIAAVTAAPAPTLLVGDPNDGIQRWDAVEAPTELSGVTEPSGATRLAFHGDDLFAFNNSTAWRVADAVHGGRDVERIAHSRSTYGVGPSQLVHSGDKRCWLLLNGRIHEWDGNKLRRTRTPLRPHECPQVLPTANGFVYVASGELVDFDTTHGIERVRPLTGIFGTRISSLNEEWAVVMTRGALSRENDLAQLWNRFTDEWLRIPLGALGANVGIRQMLRTPDGSVWAIYDGSIYDLGQLSALVATLRARPSVVITPPPFTRARKRLFERA